MMKVFDAKLQVMLALCLLLVAAHVRADAEWDNGGPDNYWDTPANWAADALPGAETIAIRAGLGPAGKAVLRTKHNAGDDNTRLRVGWGRNKPGELDITSGGEINVNTFSLVGEETQGVINQDGGLLRVSFGFFMIGNKAGGDGAYNLAGGTLNVARTDMEGQSLLVGNAGAKGLLKITGGSVVTRGIVKVGKQGTLGVLGSGAQAIHFGNPDQTVGADYIQEGTLAIGIDSGGVTPIVIDQGKDGPGEKQGSGHVVFEAGALLDIQALDGAPASGTWTVMRCNGTLTDHGLKLAPRVDVGQWSFAVVGNTLQVTRK